MRNKFITLLGGFAIGTITMGVLSPELIKSYVKYNPQYGLELINKFIKDNPDIKGAVIVNASQDATQFGKAYYNNISETGRKSVIVHPYSKQGTGSDVTIVAKDEQGNLFILLAQKLKNRAQPEQGLVNQWELISGWTQGFEAESSKIQKSNYHLQETHDIAEDALLMGDKKALFSISKNNINNSPNIEVSVEYLNNLQSQIDSLTKQEVKQNPYYRYINPDIFYKHIEQKGISYNKRDYNKLQTAKREIEEEIKPGFKISYDMIEPVLTNDNYGDQNNTRLHADVTHFVVILPENKLPKIYPANFSGQREEYSLQANGTEIGDIKFINLNDLAVNNEGLVTFDNIPLRLTNIATINNIVKYVREKELQQVSDHKIVSRRNLESWVYTINPEIKLDQSANEMGEQANEVHALNKCYATQFKVQNPHPRQLNNSLKECYAGHNR